MNGNMDEWGDVIKVELGCTKGGRVREDAKAEIKLRPHNKG